MPTRVNPVLKTALVVNAVRMAVGAAVGHAGQEPAMLPANVLAITKIFAVTVWQLAEGFQAAVPAAAVFVNLSAAGVSEALLPKV